MIRELQLFYFNKNAENNIFFKRYKFLIYDNNNCRKYPLSYYYVM